MDNGPLIFVLTAWPVFSAVTLLIVPQTRQAAFGRILAFIGIALAGIAATLMRDDIPVPRITYFMAALLPLLAMYRQPSTRDLSLIFVVAYISMLLCLPADTTRIGGGLAALAFLNVVIEIRASQFLRPVLTWGLVNIGACILLLAGAALLHAHTQAHLQTGLSGTLVSSLAVSILALTPILRSTETYITPLVTALRWAIALAAMGALARLPVTPVSTSAVIAVGIFSAVFLFTRGQQTARLCWCLTAMTVVLPGLAGATLIFALMACIDGFDTPQESGREAWMSSLLPPSPLLPATLALIWNLGKISATLGAALILLVLAQYLTRRPEWPRTLSWQKAPRLWLLLVLGLTSPAFVLYSGFFNGTPR